MKNDSLNIKRREVHLTAFGALTAVTAGAGIDCSIGYIFAACGCSTKNRSDIDFSIRKLEKTEKLWIKVQKYLIEKFYFVAS